MAGRALSVMSATTTLKLTGQVVSMSTLTDAACKQIMHTSQPHPKMSSQTTSNHTFWQAPSSDVLASNSVLQYAQVAFVDPPKLDFDLRLPSDSHGSGLLDYVQGWADAFISNKILSQYVLPDHYFSQLDGVSPSEYCLCHAASDIIRGAKSWARQRGTEVACRLLPSSNSCCCDCARPLAAARLHHPYCCLCS